MTYREKKEKKGKEKKKEKKEKHQSRAHGIMYDHNSMGKQLAAGGLRHEGRARQGAGADGKCGAPTAVSYHTTT
jgi:hypothetical protein